MRIVLIAAGVVVTVVAIVLAVGWSLPVAHRASSSRVLKAAPESVFRLITNVEDAPRWRTGVERVEVLERDAGGQPLRFREKGSDGEITYRVQAREPVRRLVTKIDDKSLPFGGTWTYDLEPVAGGTQLTITEDGEVYNPVFRFVSRYIMGHTRTIERYFDDAGKFVGPTSFDPASSP